MNDDPDSSLLDDDEETELELEEERGTKPTGDIDSRRRVERRQELMRLRKILEDPFYEFDEDE